MTQASDEFLERVKRVEKDAYREALAHRLDAGWHRRLAALIALLSVVAGIFTLLDYKWSAVIVTAAVFCSSSLIAFTSDRAYADHFAAHKEFEALRLHALNTYTPLPAPVAQQPALRALLGDEQNKRLQCKVPASLTSSFIAWLFTAIRWHF